MQRLILCFVMIFTLVCSARAQLDVQLSQYWAVPAYFNPGASGATDKLSIAALSRTQWVGVSNAPSTFFVTADMPISFMKKQHGIGLVVNNDKAGLFSSTDFGAQYAYQMQLWGGQLALGLRVGITSQSFDGTKVEIPETPDHNPSDDAIPQTVVSGMAFDAAFGAYYTHRYFTLSFSANHLSAPTIELDEKSMIKLDRVYYLMGTGNIPTSSPLIELHPSFLLKTTFQFTQFDVTCRLRYNKMFSVGLSYRHNDAVVALLGAEFKGVRVGYAYDIGTSDFAQQSGGSHEVYAGYAFKLKLKRKISNKHKSIRIL